MARKGKPDKLEHPDTPKRGLFGVLAGDYSQRALTLLLLVYVLDFADRALIGALGPTLKQVFSLDNTMLGLLVTVVSIVSALATIPLGILADRVRRTWLLAISLTIWLVAEGLTGAAVGFVMLILVRVFLGIISATSGPTIPSLVGDLVPARQRARTFGFVTSGQLVGMGIGFLLPVIVLSFADWRLNFWILAVAGALLSIGFWRLREPARTGAAGVAPERDDENHPATRVQRIIERRGVTPSRRAILTGDVAAMNMWEATKYVLRVRTDVIVLIARAIGDFFFQAIGIFAVIFATGWYHLSQSQADLIFLVIGIGALAGVLLVGRLADALLRREWITSRVWIGALAFILAPVAIFPAISTHSLFIAIPLLAAGAFLLVGSFPTLDAVRVDVLLPRMRGRGESIRQVLRTIAEGAAPVLIGFLSGRLGGGGANGLHLAIAITLPFLLFNGLILLLAVRTYPHDVAAALVSSRRNADEEPHEQQGGAA